MKTNISDPWCCVRESEVNSDNRTNHFEDSFVSSDTNHTKLADSEEYLEKLYCRLRNLQKGTSKKDLVTSLSEIKEDTIARLIATDCKLESESDIELAANPLLRHIAPHLQALTTSELVHLLKADVLQSVTESEQEEIVVDPLSTNQIKNNQVKEEKN